MDSNFFHLILWNRVKFLIKSIYCCHYLYKEKQDGDLQSQARIRLSKDELRTDDSWRIAFDKIREIMRF